MKYFSIICDGIDRCGKGTVEQYLKILGRCKYVLMDRGIVSNIAYAKKFNRDYAYDIEQFRSWVFVHLECDKEDWEVRCKLTNEPTISYEDDIKMFRDEFKQLKDKGFHVISLNTSVTTPYDCAKIILKYMEKLNVA